MVAYWLARVTVSDSEAYAEYAKRATPAIEGHGGKFLARGGRSITMEGDDFARNVVVEFPSYDRAVACYKSPEYQEAKACQDGAAVRNLWIVEGI